MFKILVSIVVFVIGHSSCYSQHFSLAIGAAGGASQMDGDNLFGFDKFMFKGWVQPTYRHNKHLTTIFRLGFGSNGSQYPGTVVENDIQKLQVSHEFYELYFLLGEEFNFGGFGKVEGPHSFLLGLSLNRNFNWVTSTNQNKFAISQFEVDPVSFKSQGIALHFSYLYRLTSRLKATALLDYYLTNLLEIDFLKVRKIYPITLGVGLQFEI